MNWSIETNFNMKCGHFESLIDVRLDVVCSHDDGNLLDIISFGKAFNFISGLFEVELLL